MHKKHDFFHFMASVRTNIANDYKFVRTRSRDDPGTAGDQVEEQWADILRKWLPATYHVVTKGRILFEDRSTSPQLDVLVLKPSYPLALRNEKFIFSGGILACFECKLTLRTRDISKSFQTCAVIKRKSSKVLGTPQDELYRLPIFGVLAHSHDIRTKDGKSRLYECIERAQTKYADHLLELVDVICVADEATVLFGVDLLIGPTLGDAGRRALEEIGLAEAISAMYATHTEQPGEQMDSGRILAGLVHDLTRRLALHDPLIRDWADHLSSIGSYLGIGRPIYTSVDELSDEVVSRLRINGFETKRWSKWSQGFP